MYDIFDRQKPATSAALKGIIMLLDVKIPPWLFWKGFIAQGAGKLLISDHHGDEDNDHSCITKDDDDNFHDLPKILVSN